MKKVTLILLMISSLVMAESYEAPPPPKPLLTKNNLHKYLGFATLVAGGIAAVSPKEENGIHEYAGYSAGFLGLATAATGLAFHYEDIELSNGFKDPDNLHALLGGGGALLMAAGLTQAPEESHAGPAMIGLGAMMISVYITW